jgi:Flp pilus assembly protein TadB
VARRDVVRSLALTRYRLEAATERFASMTGGVDHPLLDGARSRLKAADRAATNAAGGLSRWTRTWIGVPGFGAVAWAVAALCDRAGLCAGWTIAATVAAAGGAALPVVTFTNALAARVNRNRTQRPSSLPPIAAPLGVGPAAEVLALLRMARNDLAAAVRWRVAPDRFRQITATAAGFDWLRRHDPQLFWLSLADRHLCQVICSIEGWLPTVADEV